MARRSAKSRTTRKTSSSVSRRAQVVWGALLASMTVVGGMLYALDQARAPRAAGATLTPLYNATNVRPGKDIEPSVEFSRGWTDVLVMHANSPFLDPDQLNAQYRDQGGLPCHFIIGNGNGMDDGGLHKTSRWMSQKPAVNSTGSPIGGRIVVVMAGNGDRGAFSDLQKQTLAKLIQDLRSSCGTLSVTTDQSGRVAQAELNEMFRR